MAVPAPPTVLHDLPEPDHASRFHSSWRVITYLLVMIGFMGLAFTGEIHPIGIVVFLGGWILGLITTRPPAWWSRWTTHLLVWIALVPIGIIALSGQFSSLLYLLLFLGLFKCLSLREPMDHLHATLMAFFMLLATSIITTSITFIILVLAFLALMTLELLCFNLARDVERSGALPLIRGFRLGRNHGANRRGFIAQLSRHALGIGLLTVLFGFGLFLVMPQYSGKGELAGTLAKLRPPEPERASGYGDEVNFGVFDKVALDKTRVLSIELLPDPDDPAGAQPRLIDGLYVRGTSLDTYDERRWTQRPDTSNFNSTAWRVVPMPQLSALPAPRIHQEISQQIQLTKRLFGIGQPVQFDFDWRYPRRLQLTYRANALARVVDRTGWSQDYQELDLKYRVISRLVSEASPLLRLLARGTMPTGEPSRAIPPRDPAFRLDSASRGIYTALPGTELSQQLLGISQRQANAPDQPGKMLQLLEWLQTDFTYDLSPETPRGMHPIEAFLLRTRKGHCEYFATACCLLLRAQGIPARLVTGFYTSEYNSNTKNYIVRQSDAHAWVEVWLDGYGWMTLDPTPPAHRGQSQLASTNPPWHQRLGNQLQSFWQQYILYYSTSQQEQLYISLLTNHNMYKLSRLAEKFSDLTGLESFNTDWFSSNGMSRQLTKYMQFVGVLTGLCVLLLLYRLLRRRQKATQVAVSPTPFMNTLLLRLQALGWKRNPGQTPAELLLAVDAETGGRWQLGSMLEIYHRHRFDREQPTEAELDLIEERIKSIQ